ncbi:MAG: GGDEF domain-containing protein [Desulfovibrio sp.]|jgi:diguanylate cyclase (GGDEF)-like protein|nr:GGDEF domain-containing protein [Desulfovibrio sp.]
MSEEKDLAYSILQLFGIAVLQRTGKKQYVFCGKPPMFYKSFFPSTKDGLCNSPWEHSPLLEFFIEDAERFFELKKQGVLTSGIWQEDGKTESETAMVAVAATFGEKQILIIRLLREEFKERLVVMRKARGQLLQSRQLSQSLEFFQKKSRVDGLTRVFNKETFSELLQDEMKRSRALEYPLSLLIMDIDDFKKVNDVHGHVAGDKVLRSLAECLVSTLRRGDIIARFGGEEFVVLIPHGDAEQAHSIGEKLCKNIAAINEPDQPRITVSMGCTTYIPGEVGENFLARADTGLYEAKSSGKNRVCTR